MPLSNVPARASGTTSQGIRTPVILARYAAPPDHQLHYAIQNGPIPNTHILVPSPSASRLNHATPASAHGRSATTYFHSMSSDPITPVSPVSRADTLSPKTQVGDDDSPWSRFNPKPGEHRSSPERSYRSLINIDDPDRSPQWRTTPEAPRLRLPDMPRHPAQSYSIGTPIASPPANLGAQQSQFHMEPLTEEPVTNSIVGLSSAPMNPTSPTAVYPASLQLSPASAPFISPRSPSTPLSPGAASLAETAALFPRFASRTTYTVPTNVSPPGHTVVAVSPGLKKYSQENMFLKKYFLETLLNISITPKYWFCIRSPGSPYHTQSVLPYYVVGGVAASGLVVGAGTWLRHYYGGN